jgi:hypothetical protein
MLRATFNDGQPEVPGNFSDDLPSHSTALSLTYPFIFFWFIATCMADPAQFRVRVTTAKPPTLASQEDLTSKVGAFTNTRTVLERMAT